MPLKCDISSQTMTPSKQRLWHSGNVWTERAQSSSSIGERETSCRMAFGKHLRHNDPHFTEEWVLAKETADPKRQPQIVRRSWRGKSMAGTETKWQRPPSLTLITNLFSMLEPPCFHASNLNDFSYSHARAGPYTVIYKLAGHELRA